MPIRVIGAGLGRTGTMSLQVALEALGFARCYHMTEVLAHPEHARVWIDAGLGRPVDWDALFAGYQSTVDWPGCNFYRELMAQYPDAKVILTVRDAEAWYDSALQTIYFARHAFPGWTTLLLPPMRRLHRMLDVLIWDGFFGGRFTDRASAIAAFHRHNDEVARAVPADRLLVYEVKQGWAPLCAFLGVPIPEGQEFPRVNDAAEFRGRIRRAARIVSAVSYGAATLVVLGLAGLVWILAR